MPSPFPGMDPYLERPGLWPQCHFALIYNIHSQLNSRLPARYEASMDVHVWLHEADAETRRMTREPDAFVSEKAGGAAVATQQRKITAPAEFVLPVAPRSGSRFVTIRDTLNQRVVTAIEVLSPSNKRPGEDRDAYLAKRDEYFVASVNLVEVDLLRGGLRPPFGEHAPSPFAYYVLVSRYPQFPKIEFWPIGVRDSLPEIPVPLNPDDPDCTLDLRACLDRGYEDGRWAGKADYDKPPDPPLAEPDATWARELLAQRTTPTNGTAK
jgi:uncharacterized protein DUF4058